jgi:hypothetical protein
MKSDMKHNPTFTQPVRTYQISLIVCTQPMQPLTEMPNRGFPHPAPLQFTDSSASLE